MAGLVAASAMVGVSPPFAARGCSCGSTPVKLEAATVLWIVEPVGFPIRLNAAETPLKTSGPRVPALFPATIVSWSVGSIVVLAKIPPAAPVTELAEIVEPMMLSGPTL